MANIGIFFGTDTGKTRKIAKLIHQKLGEAADAPVNINRTSLETFLSYPVLLLGTPTLGDGQLPASKPVAKRRPGWNSPMNWRAPT